MKLSDWIIVLSQRMTDFHFVNKSDRRFEIKLKIKKTILSRYNDYCHLLEYHIKKNETKIINLNLVDNYIDENIDVTIKDENIDVTNRGENFEIIL